MVVVASAPARILDIGSWTDTAAAEHGLIFAGTITAADTRVIVSGRGKSGVGVRVEPAGPGDSGHGEAALARALARHFGLDGLNIAIRYTLPPGHGLGVRAGMAVALTGALNSLAMHPRDMRQIAMIAHQMQQETLRKPLGMAAYVLAAQGRLAHVRIAPYPRVFIQPLLLSDERQARLESHLLLVLTGASLLDGQLHRWQAPADEEASLSKRKFYWCLRTLPAIARDALLREDYAALGEVMREQTRLLRRLCPPLHDPALRYLEFLADLHHCLGVLPHAHGGSAVVLCPPIQRDALAHAVRRAGYTVLPVRISPHGLRVRHLQERPVPLEIAA